MKRRSIRENIKFKRSRIEKIPEKKALFNNTLEYESRVTVTVTQHEVYLKRITSSSSLPSPFNGKTSLR